MNENVKKSLIDFDDEELLQAYRSSMKNTQWSPANYRKEMFGEVRKEMPRLIIAGPKSSRLRLLSIRLPSSFNC